MKMGVWLGLCILPAAVSAQNLIVNGSFDSPDGPLAGWTTDYAWTRNTHYVGNAARVVPVPQFSGQLHAVKFLTHGDAGSKMESVLIPYEQGGQYRATLKVQGGRFRIYFAGYQWKPGVRPHSEPTPQEMRQVYRSKAEDGQSPNWRTVVIDIPGVAASELSLSHLRKVRFITLYIWFLGEGHVDEVSVARTK